MIIAHMMTEVEFTKIEPAGPDAEFEEAVIFIKLIEVCVIFYESVSILAFWFLKK